jgi:hypothetical protein
MAVSPVTFAHNVLKVGTWEHQTTTSSSSSSPTPSPEHSASPAPSPSASPVIPKTQLRIRKTNEQSIEEKVANGSFEAGLRDWQVQGDVALISGADEFTAPFAESHMVRIGRPFNPGSPAAKNILRQRIPAGSDSLQFAYHFFSQDSLGFDEPGFVVKVGERVLLQRWASEVDLDFHGGTVGNTGWQVAVVDVSDVPAGSDVVFEFLSGNDDWNISSPVEHQSWVYLDAVSTNQAVLAPEAEVFLVGVDATHGFVQIGDDPAFQVELGQPIPLTGVNQGQYVLKSWGANMESVETPNTKLIWIDVNTPAAIEDFRVEQIRRDRFFFRWSSPRDLAPWGDDSLASRVPMKYEVRYMIEDPESAEIDDPRWQEVVPLGVDSGPIAPRNNWWSPRPIGEEETYEVELPQIQSGGYLAIWSLDAAGNYSPRSNLVHVTPPGPEIEFYETSENVVEFVLTAPVPVGYEEVFVEYAIDYPHLSEDGGVREFITGQFQAVDWQYRLGNFFLGSCSDGVCLPHVGIRKSDVILTVIISAEGMGSQELQKRLVEEVP